MFFFFSFLRPINDSEEGYCPASILKLYFDTLNEDLKKNVTKGPLFYTGTGKPGTKSESAKSSFTRNLMGVHTLGDVGKEVARFLKLENPLKYTGHCFR